MKKYFFIALVFSIFTACQKQHITPESEQLPMNAVSGSNNSQVSICHYNPGSNSWNSISISINALPTHLLHGDAVDMDEDGYYTIANSCSSIIDCNDNDPLINPGAEEVCYNGIDDNCDGNVDENCFQSVTICEEIWMLKNLDVSSYRNGDPIPQVTDPVIWETLTTGAWCYYNNDPANESVYGKLYNWYAVNDPRGLAPDGWHVATDAEWTILTTCLGGPAVAGGKMKETGISHWSSPNFGATNSSGFTALPGAFRFGNGSFGGSGIGIIGDRGDWWGSTEAGPGTAWGRHLDYRFELIGRGFDGKKGGFSVRCVKD